ncbi:MAG: DUF3078 domain-containing protein [Bacteroidia bacterium]|nr:DUF3078 domain-containing protein [Bacteroidia bacterium]
MGWAQDTEANSDTTRRWNFTGTVGGTFSTVQLDNWAGGGQNSLSIGTLNALSAVRDNERSHWANTLNLAFGIARIGGRESIFKKTDDQLILGTELLL